MPLHRLGVLLPGRCAQIQHQLIRRDDHHSGGIFDERQTKRCIFNVPKADPMTSQLDIALIAIMQFNDAARRTPRHVPGPSCNRKRFATPGPGLRPCLDHLPHSIQA